MGIDITMSAGVGVHVTSDQIDEWLKTADPDEEGAYEAMEHLLYERFPDLEYASPNDSWSDTKPYARGFVILVSRVSGNFDMGREAKAGVYRPGKTPITLQEREQLNAVSREIAGKELPIEPIICVGVS